TRIWAAAAVSSPPPSVAPCSAAMKGMLPRAIASKKVLRLNGNGNRSERPFFQLSAAQRRSSPAQKLSPWPKMMPHFASSPARSIAWRNCRITVGLKQLRLSGRLRPTRAIPPLELVGDRLFFAHELLLLLTRQIQPPPRDHFISGTLRR